MGIYEELHVPRIINAMGTYTIYGGSKMSSQTIEDMKDAAASFIDLNLLQKKTGQAIARLTLNEAAYVCNGAAAGIYLGLLAAVALHCGKKIRYLTRQDLKESQILVFRSHRSPYDIVMEQLGVSVTELAYSNHTLPCPQEDMDAAISHRTAAIYYLESGWTAPGAPSLKETIEAAKRHGLPIILDAAAMLPPADNLWKYTKAGVDLAVFSGGKDLKGPQASGLILGRKELIDLLLESAFPKHGYGRFLKVGKEEIVGLYSALKQYLAQDQEARLQDAEDQVKLACSILNAHPGYQAARSYPNEAGQPIPRVLVNLTGQSADAKDILCYLSCCSPPIIASAADQSSFYLNPMTLTKEEMEWICSQILLYSR
ncbi:MAG: aminotransferase class V-fold PLP-dependent enzyme [Lachnospiraceae bacterium]|jgi:uncharacterized pyridoxal phosphate-dependent enzyme|nr:aminotransferase class V-fold PLP-dependent enzyme [Lachnospiraceae bacterium]